MEPKCEPISCRPSRCNQFFHFSCTRRDTGEFPRVQIKIHIQAVPGHEREHSISSTAKMRFSQYEKETIGIRKKQSDSAPDQG